jgi:hypothetical protein
MEKGKSQVNPFFEILEFHNKDLSIVVIQEYQITICFSITK